MPNRTLLLGVAVAALTACSRPLPSAVGSLESSQVPGDSSTFVAKPHLQKPPRLKDLLYYMLYERGVYKLPLHGGDDADAGAAPSRLNAGDSLGGMAVDTSGNVYGTWFDAPYSGFQVLDSLLNPIRTVTLQQPYYADSGIAVDRRGLTYLGYTTSSGQTGIDVFAADATGYATPVRVVAGSKTHLLNVEAMVPDTDGRLYVLNAWNYPVQYNEVDVFGAGANGDVRPKQVIKGDQTGLVYPEGIALGADDNLYIANNPNDGTFQVLVFPKAANGNVPPLRVLQSTTYGHSIALGSGGEVYLGPASSANQGIAIFAPGASGYAVPIGFVGTTFKRYFPRSLALNHPWKGL
jgi:hypothetical protein